MFHSLLAYCRGWLRVSRCLYQTLMKKKTLGIDYKSPIWLLYTRITLFVFSVYKGLQKLNIFFKEINLPRISFSWIYFCRRKFCHILCGFILVNCEISIILHQPDFVVTKYAILNLIRWGREITSFRIITEDALTISIYPFVNF